MFIALSHYRVIVIALSRHVYRIIALSRHGYRIIALSRYGYRIIALSRYHIFTCSCCNLGGAKCILVTLSGCVRICLSVRGIQVTVVVRIASNLV